MNISNIFKYNLVILKCLIILTQNIYIYSEINLDLSFGGNNTGMVSLNSNTSYLSSLITQSDGSIFVGGSLYNSFNIFAFDSNGIINNSFGTSGVASYSNDQNNIISSMALQLDGSLVLAGSSNNTLAIVRFTNNGTIDTSFGVNGVVTTLIGDGCAAKSVAIQTDQKIVISGNCVISGFVNLFIARYDNSGNLDGSFGGTGIVTADLANCIISSMCLQSDGKIVLVGTYNESFFVTRYNTDGTIDSTFGSNGIASISIASNDRGLACTIQNDGKIIIAGSSFINGALQFVIIRFNTDGSLDTTFGSSGIVITQILSSCEATTVTMKNDQKIVVGGYTKDQNDNYYFAFVQYNTDGSIDTTFSSMGYVIVSGGIYCTTSSLCTDPYGRILAAGLTFTIDESAIGTLLRINDYVPFINMITNITDYKTTITGYASNEDSLVNIFVNNSLLSTVTTDDQGLWSYLTPILLTAGVNSIEADLIVSSSIIASMINTYTITDPDNINILFPINMTTLNTTSTIVFGTSTLNSADVEISVDGLITSTVITNSIGDWIGSLNLINGTHSVGVSLLNSGSTLATDSVSVTANVPNTILITNPSLGLITTSTIISIKGSSNAANFNVYVFVDGKFDQAITSNINGSWNAGSISLGLGQHAISVQQIDNSGSIIASATNNFTIVS